MKKVKNKKKLILTVTVLIILFVMIILFGVFKLHTRIMEIIYPREYDNFVVLYAQEFQVDENLIYAIIKAESNFNPEAVSGKSAKGLMQLVDDTALDIAKQLGIDMEEEEIIQKLNDVDFNIRLGTKYISMLIEKYENISLALTAYNAGIGTVDTWIEKGTIQEDGSDVENIPYKETNQYVRKILRDYKIYQDLYA